MSKLDYDLAGALKQAKTKSMYFALVVKAPGEGTLIVSKSKVPLKAISEAKTDIGGGQVFQGRCSGDTTGQLIFETGKEPPPNLAKTIKAVISRDAHLTLKVDARRAPGLTDDGDDVDQDALRKRLTTLAEQYAKILKGPAAKGPDANSLKTNFEGIKTLMAKEEWAGVAKGLDEIERLIGRARAGAVLYQIGFDDGKAQFGANSPNHRAAVAKHPVYSELIHYYDEGFSAGRAAPLKMPDYYPPNNAPTMGPNTMTKDQEEEGRRIDESRKELRRVLRGEGGDDMPHTHVEPPEIVNPPIAD